MNNNSNTLKPSIHIGRSFYFLGLVVKSHNTLLGVYTTTNQLK